MVVVAVRVCVCVSVGEIALKLLLSNYCKLLLQYFAFLVFVFFVVTFGNFFGTIGLGGDNGCC